MHWQAMGPIASDTSCRVPALAVSTDATNPKVLLTSRTQATNSTLGIRSGVSERRAKTSVTLRSIPRNSHLCRPEAAICAGLLPSTESRHAHKCGEMVSPQFPPPLRRVLRHDRRCLLLPRPCDWYGRIISIKASSIDRGGMFSNRFAHRGMTTFYDNIV